MWVSTVPESEPCLDILFVGVLPPFPGGGAISPGEILAGLAGDNHRVRAVAPITAQGLRDGDAFAARHPNIEVTRFLIPFYEVGPNVPAPPEYREIERQGVREILPALIARRRPDVVVAGRETFAWDLPDIAAAHAVPSVLRISGGVTLALRNGTYPQALARPLLQQFRKFRLMIVQARHVADALKTLGFGNIAVIPNAVQVSRFAPGPKPQALRRELAIGSDDVVVAHVSNLKSIKRPLDFVESASEALREDPRLVYLVVGDGSYRSLMEEACRDKGIADRFRFVGWVEYERMPEYLRLADIVVMPSDAEQQARVYLETQACGRLLLASDIAGAKEVAVDSQTALLFRKGDIADLTAKTLLAARDPELRARIGREACIQAQSWSTTEAVAAYAAALRSIVQPAAVAGGTG